MREGAQYFNNREVNHIGHQRQAASVTVSQQAKQQRSQRTHGQRSGYRSNDRGFAYMKLCSEGVVEKDDNEEIKGIERPAKETGGDGVSGAGRVRHAMALLNYFFFSWYVVSILAPMNPSICLTSSACPPSGASSRYFFIASAVPAAAFTFPLAFRGLPANT